MVLKDLERIKAALPDLIHVAMLYDDGTVFQTTFDSSDNIPKFGEHISEILKHFSSLFEIWQIEQESYLKLIYETANLIIMLLKLGENSNLVLLFRKGKTEPNISAIRRYLLNIEKLIDTDKYMLDKQLLEQLKVEVANLEKEHKDLLNQIEKEKGNLENIKIQMEEVAKEITSKENEIYYEDTVREKLEHELDTKKEEITEIAEKTEKKIVKSEIKEGRRQLNTFKKELSKKEKEIEKLKKYLLDLEREMQRSLNSIKTLKEECESHQQKISEKHHEISELEQKIMTEELDVLEKKLLELK
ncbi:MAG: hypothetical protein ACTSRS_16450 [Candidatus Helarchaeota archaeon]